MKQIAVLTGAGISAESGISTFRDSGGLWENFDVMQVASIEGWYKDPKLVQEFYNMRRTELEHAQPNQAHKLVASLEKDFAVTVITQNVDNLHERGGSTNIIHLHGELTKARGEKDTETIIEIGYRPIQMGEKAPDGSQLRPHIVWFGEAVPMIEPAARAVSKADILIIIGTSLNVYPAAGLVAYAKDDAQIYLIDPAPVQTSYSKKIQVIAEKATIGMEQLTKILNGIR